MAQVYNPGHWGRNPFGNTNGMSAQQANDQYKAGLGGGIGQQASGFRYNKPQPPKGGGNAARVAQAAISQSNVANAVPQPTTAPQPSVSQAAHNAVTGATPNYQTSIDANPIFSQQQIDQAKNQARTSSWQQLQSPSGAYIRNQVGINNRLGAGSGAANAMGESANLFSKFAGDRNAQEIDRSMTQANAQQVLQAQQARAQEGLSLANMLQQDKLAQQQMQFQAEQAARNQGMNLVGMMLGGLMG